MADAPKIPNTKEAHFERLLKAQASAYEKQETRAGLDTKHGAELATDGGHGENGPIVPASGFKRKNQSSFVHTSRFSASHLHAGQSLAWTFAGMAIACGGALFLPVFAIVALGSGAIGAAIVLAFLLRSRKTAETEIEQAESDLHLALAKANNDSETKSKFLAMVSHEIRTPLNGVLGMAQLLKETPLDAAQADYVKAIDTSGRALLGLIEDLLDSARIEAGEFDLQSGPCDVRQVVEDVADILAPRARAKGVDIASHVSKSIPQSVVLDAARLRQVLLNLAGNAAKFTSEGGIAITVSKRCDRLHFSVTDTGPGLSESDQNRIFDEFVQASGGSTRAHEGAGLGLAISRRLVEGMAEPHGSTLQLESRLGSGSNFYFALPLVRDNPSPQPKQNVTTENRASVVLKLKQTPARCAIEATLNDLGVMIVDDVRRDTLAVIADKNFVSDLPNESAALPIFWLGDAGQRTHQTAASDKRWLTWPVRTSTLERLIADTLSFTHKPSPHSPSAEYYASSEKPLSVLVAEDNDINAMLVTALLGKLGHTVIRVHNGIEAVAAIERGKIPFDLVLMDMHMPEMDGMEAIEKIRHWERSNSAIPIPIYVLSADGQETAREAAIGAGGNGFLLKPLDVDAVRALLQRDHLAA